MGVGAFARRVAILAASTAEQTFATGEIAEAVEDFLIGT
jgi:hypothetical protein